MQLIKRYITIPLATILLATNIAVAKDATGFAPTGKTSEYGSKIFMHKIEAQDTIDGIVQGFNEHDDNRWGDRFRDVRKTNLAFSPWKERTDVNLTPGKFIYIYAKPHGQQKEKQIYTPKNQQSQQKKRSENIIERYVPPKPRVNKFAREEFRHTRRQQSSTIRRSSKAKRTIFMQKYELFYVLARDENNNQIYKYKLKKGDTIKSVMAVFNEFDRKYEKDRYYNIQQFNLMYKSKKQVTNANIRQHIGEFIYISSLQPRY